MSFKFVMLPPQTRDHPPLGTTTSPPPCRKCPWWSPRTRPGCRARDRRRRRRVRPPASPTAGRVPGSCAGCNHRRSRRPPGYYYPELVAHRRRRHQHARDLQRPYRRAHHGLRARLRARLPDVSFRSRSAREWRPRPEDTGVVHLPESTALIVGVGGIGAEAARLAAAFGMTVIGTDARRTDAPPGVSECTSPSARRIAAARRLRHPHGTAHAGDRGLHEPRAVPAHEEDRVLHQHRPGQNHKLDDLVAALRGRRDRRRRRSTCSSRSRCRQNHPLWTMPNVLITPHMAGYGPYLNDRRYEIIRDNCRAMLSGGKLRNLVDKASWF